MSSLSVFDHLAMHPFAADLPAEWLHRLALHARPVMRPAGRRLFREDGPADRCWLVRSGDVALDFPVPGRGDVVIDHVGPGGVVGWSWLLPPFRCTLGGVVAQDLRAVELDAPAVRRLIHADPDLGRELTTRFLRLLAERLLATRSRLTELYAYPADPQSANHLSH